MANEKITKAQVLAIIAEGMADNADVVAYCENELALLESKKIKARARQDAKRAAGDELYAEVIACVGETPVTADTVYAENFADYEDLSVAKIRARLSQGVKNEVLAKETIKVDGKAKVHYTRIAE